MTNGPKLNPDETVVLRCEGVGYGNTMFGKNHELILTNQAILLQKMGLFGKPKDVLRFPLTEIRVVNGQVQVMMGKKDFVTPSLDVYFESGMESFLITWEKDIRHWIKTITNSANSVENRLLCSQLSLNHEINPLFSFLLFSISISAPFSFFIFLIILLRFRL